MAAMSQDAEAFKALSPTPARCGISSDASAFSAIAKNADAFSALAANPKAFNSAMNFKALQAIATNADAFRDTGRECERAFRRGSVGPGI